MKLKTHKGSSKRFKISKTGKVLMKKAGQNHFNARESSKITRNKRRINHLAKSDMQNIKTLLAQS